MNTFNILKKKYVPIKTIIDIEGQIWSISRFFVILNRRTERLQVWYLLVDKQIPCHFQLEKLFLNSYLWRKTKLNLTFLWKKIFVYKLDQTLIQKSKRLLRLFRKKLNYTMSHNFEQNSCKWANFRTIISCLWLIFTVND